MSTAGVGGDALTQAGHIRAWDAARPVSNSLTDGDHLLEGTNITDEEAIGMVWTAAVYTMVRGHGCPVKGCRKRRHKADLEVMSELLKELGLIPDPETDRPVGLGYRKRQEYTAKGEAG